MQAGLKWAFWAEKKKLGLWNFKSKKLKNTTNQKFPNIWWDTQQKFVFGLSLVVRNKGLGCFIFFRSCTHSTMNKFLLSELNFFKYWIHCILNCHKPKQFWLQIDIRLMVSFKWNKRLKQLNSLLLPSRSLWKTSAIKLILSVGICRYTSHNVTNFCPKSSTKKMPI